MALTVRLYTFVKNPNSTKRPSGDPLHTYDNVTLNDPTDLLSPEFRFNPAEYAYANSANYLHVVSIGKYYFIDRWRWEGGLWIASCTIDVLATHKYAIGEQSAYVTRSASRYDGTITDTMYPATNAIQQAQCPSLLDFTTNIRNGTYVVGVLSNTVDAVGAVTYYAFSDTQIGSFSDFLMSNIDWMYDGVDDMSEGLFKNFANPTQYITSCMWFPISTGYFNGEVVSSIPYGYWTITATATRLESFLIEMSINFNNIPKHPQAASRGSYLNHAPYAKYWITWPAVGTIAIDQDIVAESSAIGGELWIDAITGKATTLLRNSSNVPIMTLDVQCAIPFTLGQTSYDGLLGGAVNSFGSYITGGAQEIGGVLGDVLGSVYTGLISALGMKAPIVTTVGGSGGTTSFYGFPILCCEFYEIVDEDNARVGRPLCEKVTINTLSGFIMCADSKVLILGSYDEQQRVRELMNGGFFYE